MPVKKIAHYIRGAAGRGDEGTKTGTLLHFSKGSLPKLLEIALGFLRQEVARQLLDIRGHADGKDIFVFAEKLAPATV